MKNVTLTLQDDVLGRARVQAAKEGKSLSKFVSELVERRVGRPMKSQSEALEAFLAGPPLPLLDENGNAPTTDQLYE
jgi:predicted CopG family antitoxin